ncbi:helix-turn-helix domain-containing protein [Thermoactinomyces sp. CICC 10521]|uniref:helix-turn-helix domain-containing protein n=1 Tax=Thermoactinomyces sp. CICC 10521 TaxID=2767426 RepID=UPI0018DBCC75|nr:helix-turn-helix transcriptional regulator [Thermoactinomyces sp. CICC 10521]MBH8609134.1 helix-turn-helix transcriptional regulator [Thermoactinomyces sp. CICC 10521]
MNLKALAAVRKKKNVTQVQIARALGVNKSTYNRIERGEIEMKAAYLPIIARELGLAIDELSKVLFLNLEVA